MRLGICTGGGDCPGLNGVIRSVVKHGIGTYGAEIIGIRDSFNGLMERPMRIHQFSIGDVTGILYRGGTLLGTRNEGNPFKNPKNPESKKMIDRVIKGYEELQLDGLIVVGGDGTQNIAHQFLDFGLKIIGVPKTIDNDLAGTETTLGFETAVEVASEAVSRLESTAESHERIMILEVMGRDAGHIALHSGMAGGANIILLPEIPFNYESIIKKINERRKLGRFFSLAVVAEGAYPKGKERSFFKSSGGSVHLGGVGQLFANELHKKTGLETRVTVLGHIQRGGTPCARDRILSTAFGAHAVDLAVQKKFGRVVVWRSGNVEDVPYTQLVNKNRPLDLSCSLVKAAESIGICLGRETKFRASRGRV